MTSSEHHPVNDNQSNQEQQNITMSENNEQPSSRKELRRQESDSRVSPHGTRNLIVGFLVALVLVVGLSAAAAFFVQPWLKSQDANKVLSTIGVSRGDIRPQNTTLSTFSGQLLKNANVNQKALTGGGIDSSAGAVLGFTNGKDGDKKTLDLYIDFNGSSSRDFVLLNQTSLRSMVESGQVDLRVHPVPSGTALSIYSPEVVAESFVTTPGKSWSLLLETLKLSSSLETDKRADVVAALVDTASKSGVKGIDKESITNGTFGSWIFSNGNDARIQNQSVPVAYVNGQVINRDSVDYNDSDKFAAAVLGK